MAEQIVAKMGAFALICSIAFAIFWLFFFKITPNICIHFSIIDGLGKFVVYFIFGYFFGVGIPLTLILIYLIGSCD